MYVTATGAFLPPNLPILVLATCVPRAAHIGINWAWPSSKGGNYIPTHCAMSLN